MTDQTICVLAVYGGPLELDGFPTEYDFDSFKVMLPLWLERHANREDCIFPSILLDAGVATRLLVGLHDEGMLIIVQYDSPKRGASWILACSRFNDWSDVIGFALPGHSELPREAILPYEVALQVIEEWALRGSISLIPSALKN